MSVENIAVEWLPEAENLLRKRDRHTRNAIHLEFDGDPTKDAIEFDPVQHCYATPVADNRFTVVWNLESDKKIAKVLAVVPTQFVGNDMELIKTQISEVVSIESKKKITIS